MVLLVGIGVNGESGAKQMVRSRLNFYFLSHKVPDESGLTLGQSLAYRFVKVITLALSLPVAFT